MTGQTHMRIWNWVGRKKAIMIRIVWSGKKTDTVDWRTSMEWSGCWIGHASADVESGCGWVHNACITMSSIIDDGSFYFCC